MECKSTLLLILIISLSACTKDPYIDDLRKHKVSYVTIEIVDSDRERSLPTKIWYPAEESSNSEPHNYDDRFRGYISENAAIKSPSIKRPLILLSHGTGGSNASLSWLAEILASNGYVVAAPNHWNNTTRNNTPAGIVRLWDRPKDLSFVLDYLLADEYWRSNISEAHIGAAGHSAGGFAVLGLAGAKFSIEKMNSFCKSSPNEKDCTIVKDIVWDDIDISDDQLPYKDTRIKSVLAMAPAVGRGVSKNSLTQIEIPVKIVAALDDAWLPFDANAKYYADSIPDAMVKTFIKGGHFLFHQECAPLKKLIVRVIVDEDICGSESTVDRRAPQHATASMALSLFSNMEIGGNNKRVN
ncbi:MAG: hypothetical protein HRU20_30115 [Pseudomonadales bacterium]|nr:hypothetical protein [Pseudomonadales bacterium]